MDLIHSCSFMYLTLRSEYLLMDMTRMPIKDHSFDIVIEKATLDSLLVTAKSPWNFQSEENLLGNFFRN